MNADRCPEDAQLRAFEAGALTGSALAEVAGHLKRCPRCQSRVGQARTERDLSQPGHPPAVGGSGGEAATLLPPVMGKPAANLMIREASTAIPYPFLAPAQSDGEIGRLGNYRVIRLLGKGGMGFVFHAEDLSLGRAVALKVMRPELGDEPESWQRFSREARVMAALKHAHLVTVYQVGQENGVIYLAMELLEGESLLDRLKSGTPFNSNQVIRLAREMAGALAVIHRQGLIHRDIKPANIWLESPGDRVKVLDFGLARRIQDESHVTQTGMVVGTPSFMSPEQARGDPLDARSDLFSLGSVLYCMCTGSEPFSGPNVTAVLTSLAVDAPQPVHELAKRVPRPVSDLIMQLLSKKLEQRPASAEAVVECLRQIEGGEPIPQAVPLGPPGQWRTWLAGMSQRQRMAAVGVLLGVVFAVILFSAVRGRSGRGTRPVAGNTAPTQSQPVFVKSLKPIASVNWPLPLTPEGTPMPRDPFRVIRVNGKLSPNGIGMHPSFDGPASVSYSLGKQYRTFEAQVSLNESSSGSHSPIHFRVFGDGRLLWESKPVGTDNDTQDCKVSVEGVDVLKLEADARGMAHGAHGVWLEPMLRK